MSHTGAQTWKSSSFTMDSTGLGIVMRLHVRCRSRGIQLIVTGAGPRVLELFRLTKVDDLLLAK